MLRSRSERVIGLRNESVSQDPYFMAHSNLASSKPMEKIVKRIRPDQLALIRSGDLNLCKNLRFFMQYPEVVQDRLLKIA